MDSNLPLVVRGPGIAENAISHVASAHLDFAPTFLDIMGLPESEWPELLDGRSLLSEWQSGADSEDQGDAKEILNIEFWGDKIFEAPSEVPWPSQNSYKTLRIVSEGSSWLFVKWCSNEVELYNTTVSFASLDTPFLAPFLTSCRPTSGRSTTSPILPRSLRRSASSTA